MIAFPTSRRTPEANLQAVHGWAHAHFTYVRDEVRWPAGSAGIAPNGDHWETDQELLADIEATGRVHGDCDAFAKLCWMALRRLGIPSRLVFCTDETGGGHLVCESSGWILDNRQPVIVSRDELGEYGYRWLTMSAYEPGGQWTTAA